MSTRHWGETTDLYTLYTLYTTYPGHSGGEYPHVPHSISEQYCVWDVEFVLLRRATVPEVFVEKVEAFERRALCIRATRVQIQIHTCVSLLCEALCSALCSPQATTAVHGISFKLQHIWLQ